jgi:geranylgeranyl transferase type-2 subunit beta
MNWIDREKLVDFILKAQNADSYSIPCGDLCGGGIADRPGNMADIFHTFFGISGLSLLGYFDRPDWNHEGESTPMPIIDPTYALPRDLVRKLGLFAQTLPEV